MSILVDSIRKCYKDNPTRLREILTRLPAETRYGVELPGPHVRHNTSSIAAAFFWDDFPPFNFWLQVDEEMFLCCGGEDEE